MFCYISYSKDSSIIFEKVFLLYKLYNYNYIQQQNPLGTSSPWGQGLVIYIRPISCNKPSIKNSVFFIFHRVKYEGDRILFGRFIT